MEWLVARGRGRRHALIIYSKHTVLNPESLPVLSNLVYDMYASSELRHELPISSQQALKIENRG